MTKQLIWAGTALIGVCYGFARFAYGLFAPVFQERFALDSTVIGLIGAGSYVGYGVAITAGFVLTNRFGARRVAVSAGVVATAGTVLVAAAQTGGMLAAGVLVAGMSTGLASPPLAQAIAHSVEAGKQDRAQSVVNAGTGIGVLVSGPVAMVLLTDWRWAWLTFAVLAAAVTGWIARTVPPARGATEAGSLFPAGSGPLLAAALLLGVASSAVWTFGQAGPVMWSVVGLAGLLGAFSGHLTGDLRTSWPLVLAVLAAATAALALWPGQPVVVHSAAALFGASYIALTGLILVWSTRVHPARPATGVGTAFLVIAAGQAIGSPLAGAVIDHAGRVTAFLACAAIGLAAGMIRPGEKIGPRSDPQRPDRSCCRRP